MNIPIAFKTQEVYKECRRNHAASLGYISFDGCGEFLKSDENSNVESMLCAACGCHQNFHRKDLVYVPVIQPTPFSIFKTEAFVPGSSGSGFGVSFMNGGLSFGINAEVEVMKPRRKRTIFTPEQKNQMLTFAEKLGWNAKNTEREELEHFCQQMGISRRTFVVWMCNNRRLQTEKDKDKDSIAKS